MLEENSLVDPLRKNESLDVLPTNSYLFSDEEDEYSDPELNDSEDEYESEDYIHLSNSNPVIYKSMFQNSLEEEKKIEISKERFLAVQKRIDPDMRDKAIQWLILMHYHFQMTSDTLHNALMYFNILLSKIPLEKSDIMLYGSVCYWIAGKIDTKTKPSIKDFSDYSGEKYTLDLFVNTEITICQALEFHLSFPTIMHFIRYLLDVVNCDQRLMMVSNFFVEIAIASFEYIDFRPSIIAQSSIVVACACLNEYEFARKVIACISSSSVEMLMDCIQKLKKHGTVAVTNKLRSCNQQNELQLLSLMNMDFTIKNIFCEE